MARKIIGHVQLEWTCPHCDGVNPGPAKFCMSCGSPQPEDVEFQQPPAQELITAEGQLERAKAAPDIHCPYCGVRNPAKADFCQNCGGDLAEGMSRERGRVLGAYSSEPQPPVVCDACGTENPATRRRCQACGASLARAERGEQAGRASGAPAKERPSHRAPTGRLGRLLLIGGAVMACVIGAMFLFSLFRTEELTGTVQSTEWIRSIGVEALAPVERSDWLDEIPAEAELGGCEERFHHAQDEYVAGSVEVCGTPYTIDSGTGYGEVVQDCVYEVYDEYCDYTMMEWQEVDRYELTGTGPDAAWPVFSLAEGQREGASREKYDVVFSSDEGAFTYTTSDLQEFERYTLGSEWILEVNGIGAIVDLQPAR